MKPALHVLPDADALARAAAIHWRERALSAMRQHERFSTALSGGATPAGLYRRLGADPRGVDWARVWIYFSDERCVPQDHADSNYRMASETLLARVPIPAAQIFRMSCESDLARAADDYAALLAPLQPAADMPPVLDLVLLGLGSDGHTASLFPNSPLLNDYAHWVATVVEGTPDHARLTLTLPVLNAARDVMFVVSGRGKAEIVREILGGQSDLPAGRLRPTGQVHWFLDAGAAVRLDQ